MKCKIVSIVNIFLFTILLITSADAKAFKNVNIYINRISSSLPVKQFSLTNIEVKKFNKLKDIRKSLLLSSLIAKKLFTIYQYEPWDKLIYLQLQNSWCGSCIDNMNKITKIIYLKKQNIIIKIVAHKYQ